MSHYTGLIESPGSDARILLCSGALGGAVRLLTVPVVVVSPQRAARGGDLGFYLQEETR
jgi:hypothetical protein